MKRFHVKRGDEVVVIAGTEKGKRGKVIQMLPKKERVMIEGVKMIKKHMRKSQQHPQGAIVEREGSVHVSNVMLADKYDARAAKKGASAAVEA
ncbi:MAG: 50S ribosomal protein L24 [Verrucomicrobiales bacterium]|nr:50S ribosomal protein L24 [Verrucomicrobiales bacterium]MCP5528657.1 50S ribosomal protein L24 [Verrucomicrobiales bacterium]